MAAPRLLRLDCRESDGAILTFHECVIHIHAHPTQERVDIVITEEPLAQRPDRAPLHFTWQPFERFFQRPFQLVIRAWR